MKKQNDTPVNAGLKNDNVDFFSFTAEAGYGTPIITSGYSSSGNRYIPYSSISARYNTVNTYPQMLAKLAAEAPTHSAAIHWKGMLTTGKGFDKTNLSRNIKKAMQNMNKKGQTVDDILEQVAYDYVTFGGFALKVRWTNTGKIYSVERIHFTDVRAGEPDANFDVNYYVISNNWDNTMPTRYQKTYTLPVFNPKVFENEDGTPKVLDFKDGQLVVPEEYLSNAEQIIYFYKEVTSPSTNGMYFYPVPDYTAGIDCMLQEIDINVSNKSLINNGIGGKTMVNMITNEPNQDKRRQLHNDLVKSFTGADKNGGLVVGFSLDKETLPTFTQLPALDADTYVNVKDQVIQTIVTVHNIPGIILNLRNGGSWFTNKDELAQALEVFYKTKITSYQQSIERVFNTVFSYMGYDVELQIVPMTIADIEDITSDEVEKSTTAADNTETTSLDSK